MVIKMVECEALDCKKNEHGNCRKPSKDIHLDKFGTCVGFEVNMPHLHEKWKYVKGKDGVKPHEPKFVERIKRGELKD